MNSVKSISYEDFINCVQGIWVGKFLGGTLGAPELAARFAQMDGVLDHLGD